MSYGIDTIVQRQNFCEFGIVTRLPFGFATFSVEPRGDAPFSTATTKGGAKTG